MSTTRLDVFDKIFAVLEERIASGKLEDVKGMLPAELRQLWPEEA